METLVLDTSAIFNFGHRGQLDALLKRLAKHYTFAATTVVCDECSRGAQRQFYEAFIPAHFQLRSPEVVSFPEADLRRLAATIHPGEISVILVAAELNAIAVIDDRVARNEARRLNVRVIGTLGLVESALTQHWLTDDQCLEIVARLRAGRFSIRRPGANETFAEYFRRFQNQ